MVAYLLPALFNGAWVILVTLYVNASRTARSVGKKSGTGAFGVPARFARPLGRLAGAFVGFFGGLTLYLTYERASETARSASASLGAVTPRTQHVGWYLALLADLFAGLSGFVAFLFGRGALFGPSKAQLSSRVADDELLRVISAIPEPTQVGVTPRGEAVIRAAGLSGAGETHGKFADAFVRREKKKKKF